jgi:hypothetical protein
MNALPIYSRHSDTLKINKNPQDDFQFMQIEQLLSTALRWIGFFIFSIPAFYFHELLWVKSIRVVWRAYQNPYAEPFDYVLTLSGIPLLFWVTFLGVSVLSICISPYERESSHTYIIYPWVISNILLVYLWDWHLESTAFSSLLICVIFICFCLIIHFALMAGSKSKAEK